MCTIICFYVTQSPADIITHTRTTIADYIVTGRHVYEVRECVQSLVDQVVEMFEPGTQSADISLDDDLPELVGWTDEPVKKVCLSSSSPSCLHVYLSARMPSYTCPLARLTGSSPA